MNKLSFKISTLLAVAVLFAACSNDETLTPETDGQVDISTRVNAGNEATAEGTYAPTDGTQLFLYYKEMGNADDNGTFTYNGIASDKCTMSDFCAFTDDSRSMDISRWENNRILCNPYIITSVLIFFFRQCRPQFLNEFTNFWKYFPWIGD